MKTQLFVKKLATRFFVLMSFLFLTTGVISAQECACKQGVNVSLGGNGTATVTPSMILASNSTCSGTHTVTVMKTPNGTPIAGSPQVNCSHVGQTLYAKVTNGTNSCWGTINVMDELVPVITPEPGIIELTCLELLSYEPTVIENCPGYVVNIVGETILVNNCNGQLPPNVLKRITRTYQVVDKAGNASAQVAFVFDVTIIDDLNDIDMPEPLIVLNDNALECNGNWAKIPVGQPFAGNPSPIDIGAAFGTGVPSFNGADLYPDADLHCNLAVSFTDISFTGHNCVKKIVRTWQVIEWSCANRTAAPYDQMIEIIDSQGPAIVLPANITVSTGNHNCSAAITLPQANVTDNCTPANLIEVDVTYPGGFNDNVNGGPANLGVGSHTITYTAYDKGCNSSSASMTVVVQDNTPPVSICDEFTTVALTTEGVAHVPASVLDDGSFDECSDVKMIVRRMNGPHCTPCDIPEFPGFHYMGEYGTGSDKKYYYLSKHPSTPHVAFKMAKAMGGNLVTIDSQAKDTWLWTRFLQLVQPVAPDWIDMIIGLSDLDGDGKYTWQSGSTSTYRNWGAGVPQNPFSPYVVKYHDAGGAWFAYSPAFAAKYVVEISDPCSWSSYAHFCCSDIPANQMVAFRTIDESGNYNDCMVSVRVQDKIGPTLTCPPDQEVACDFAFNLEDLVTPFGWPTATDNCEQLEIEEVDVQNTMNACRIGSITRDFEVTDAGGRTATCRQVITFEETEPFTYDDITWPENYMNLEGCADPTLPAFSPEVLGEPTFADGACALVGADYEDKVFSFNNGNGPACFKILRTWTVIDWCQTISTNGGGTTHKTWTRTQTIVVNDPEAPEFINFEAQKSVCTYDADCIEGYIELLAEGEDNCTEILAYTYKVDLNNDGSFENGYSGNGHANLIDASGVYPIGTHKIVYSFEDKCGNLTTMEQIFTIVNCKAPTPICHHGLSVNLTPMDLDQDGTIDVGMATVDIDRFNKGSYHTCPDYDLYFSFAPITVQGNTVIVQDEIVYDCDSFGLRDVKMYVGILTPMGVVNQSFCSTVIDVQDNTPACEGRLIGGLVSGRISTQKEESVENVGVSLMGTELKYNTNDNGMYIFPNLTMGRDYEVNPVKNDDVLNGVSTLDLVLIQRHILGMEALATPYDLIAADINKDKNINTVDLVDLRKVILGSQENFSNNNSWRFIDKQYKFIDATVAHQEGFNENYQINGFSKDMVVDFVGVKTGDVNGSVSPNVTSDNDSEARSVVVLTTPDQHFEQGKLVEVPFFFNGDVDMAGCQFTVQFDANTFILKDINHGITKDENMGLAKLVDGLITVSWNEAGHLLLTKDAPVFTLVLEARTSGSLQDVLEVNSSLTRAELYDQGLQIKSIQWKVAKEDNVFAVHQNVPNPFSQMTMIAFELPEAGDVICTVTDMSGKVVKQIRQNMTAGRQQISLLKSELPGSGVYSYTIQTGKHRETRMMVVFE